MRKLLAAVVGITLLASVLAAQNVAKPQAVCQGQYSALGKDGKGNPKETRLDTWRMDSMQDGSFSVNVELVRPAIEEHRLFTKEFKPKSVVSVHSGPRTGRRPMTIECDYGSTELSCHTTFDGSSAVATIAQKPPYAFVPTFEALTFDFPWAFQAVVSQAERVIGRKTTISVIAWRMARPKTALVSRFKELCKLSIAAGTQ